MNDETKKILISGIQNSVDRAYLDGHIAEEEMIMYALSLSDFEVGFMSDNYLNAGESMDKVFKWLKTQTESIDELIDEEEYNDIPF